MPSGVGRMVPLGLSSGFSRRSVMEFLGGKGEDAILSASPRGNRPKVHSAAKVCPTALWYSLYRHRSLLPVVPHEVGEGIGGGAELIEVEPFVAGMGLINA